MTTRNEKILALTARNLSAAYIAKRAHCSLSTVYNVRYNHKKANGTHLRASVKLLPAAKAVDYVNSPPHYKIGGIETIDFIEAKKLNYHLGNVTKYITRAGHKDPADLIKDLKKAQWYLNRYIASLEKNA